MWHSARLRATLQRARFNAGFSAATLAAQTLTGLALAVPWLVFVPVELYQMTLAVVVPLIVPVLATPLLTRVQRRRITSLLGVRIPPPGALRWQALYHGLVGPAVAFLAFCAFALAIAGLVAGTMYLWVWGLPLNWRLEHRGYTTVALWVTLLGLAGLLLAHWLAAAVVRLDRLAVTALLGPDPATALERRLENVLGSRTAAVEAADAERRRIERDLHDGAQQRLVSMAVGLGLAKATLTDLPEDARKVIDEAHQEAKNAIEELSSLVRGLHPQVLDDLGLDAALSGIAERAPFPVRLHVHVPERAAPTVEAVAYFVVSEALTNVAKHARATKAEVSVVRAGGALRLVIADDGVGGADPSGGTGLTGLAGRVGSVDGSLQISSPAGGPTVITVELPCAL
ncbi:histidine kinase [Streptomyces albus subsp. albus]|nr:histidine kinase [Streptomyces albus subsp. albus]